VKERRVTLMRDSHKAIAQGSQKVHEQQLYEQGPLHHVHPLPNTTAKLALSADTKNRKK